MIERLNVTSAAHERLKDLDVSIDNTLRLAVEPGGCSGMAYRATIDSVSLPLDEVLFEDAEIRIVSDPNSASYLDGVTIDYEDDLVKSGFRFINPHAVKTCGCGGSFQA
ncbi:MAG: iron-sulfur cluster assembly accessory protein [Spirochaetales bacterium]|nr:iron-sulfur cluster assembly accessory protein [Spirochaetales bacterium]